jgi:ABC-type branched-subunit amino acid transport system substrate-binding protein
VPQVIGGVLPAAGDAAKYPYVFRTAVVATLQGTTFVEYMKASGYKRAGILAVNNALGTSNVDAFKAAIGDSGIEIAATEFHESGTVDLSPQLKKVLDANPDVLLLFNTAAPDQIAAVKARKTLGSDLPMLGFSSLAYAGTAAELQKENADNVYAGQFYRRLSREPGSSEPIGGETTTAFIEELAKARGETTLTVGSEQQAGQFDSVMLIAKAAEAVGELDADKIREYLEANGYDGVRASYTYDAQRHDGVGLDDLVFSVPITLENGTAELAPNQ